MVALSLCVYPIFLRVPIEITHIFGLIEVDLFSWYRMWLIAAFGIFFLITSKEEIVKPIFFYWALVVLSTLTSKFIRTSIFGSPWNHEGAIAILSYLGLYLAGKKYGMFKGLERSFDAVIVIIFLVGIIQVAYGNFIGWLAPELTYQVIKWPMYSTLANANVLGLFSALFFPYAYYRKKYALLGMITFMLVCSQSRGGMMAVLLASILLGKKPFLYIALTLLVLSLPFYKQTLPKITNLANSLRHPTRDSAFSGRGFMWKKSLPIMKHTLLMGNGPGTFGLYFPQYTERGNAVGYGGHGEARVVDRPHNMFINIWTSTGLVSLIVLLSGIVWIILRGRDPGLVLGTFTFLICGLTTDSVLSVTPYFAIFLGVLTHKREI